MQVVRELSEETWRCFVEQQPDGNIFHTPEMFQVFAQAKGYEPSLWAVVDQVKGEEIPLALMLPVQVMVMGGALRQFTTRAIQYGSVLCAPVVEGYQAMKLLLQAYQQEIKNRVLFTELRNLSDLSELQSILTKSGFVFEDHLNYFIDLSQSEETIWQGISKSGRQSVRTARNKGVIIEEITERSKITMAYQLLQEVYMRAQIPLANVTLFEAAFDILAPRGMFKAFLAQVEGRYIGTCLLLTYKDRIIDWYAGSDRAFSAYCPNELLIWHTLQWGQKQHFHLFDFGGAGKPGEAYGPGKFKAKFGGALVNYGRNTYVHAPMRLRLSQKGYQLLRRFI